MISAGVVVEAVLVLCVETDDWVRILTAVIASGFTAVAAALGATAVLEKTSVFFVFLIGILFNISLAQFQIPTNNVVGMKYNEVLLEYHNFCLVCSVVRLSNANETFSKANAVWQSVQKPCHNYFVLEVRSLAPAICRDGAAYRAPIAFQGVAPPSWAAPAYADPFMNHVHSSPVAGSCQRRSGFPSPLKSPVPNTFHGVAELIRY